MNKSSFGIFVSGILVKPIFALEHIFTISGVITYRTESSSSGLCKIEIRILDWVLNQNNIRQNYVDFSFINLIYLLPPTMNASEVITVINVVISSCIVCDLFFKNTATELWPLILASKNICVQ